ncbi:MAG: HesA/MoeB/ThiF family protein [Geminicoccaceae bacterium]
MAQGRSLDEGDLKRHARQIVLPEIGGTGQERLLSASVLVIGAGGLGSPMLLYLAAAGVGRIGVVDFDRVDESNLQRQIAFSTDDIGRKKVEAVRDRIRALDPRILLEVHDLRLDAGNVASLIAGYDVIADGCDDLATRLCVHDAAMAAGKPLVSGAVQGLDGQLATYKAYLGPPHPCMRCLMSEEPGGDGLPTCAQGGILGAAAGVMGSLQAVEVIKELLGKESLSGRMMHYDAMSCDLVSMRLPRRTACDGSCRAPQGRW